MIKFAKLFGITMLALVIAFAAASCSDPGSGSDSTPLSDLAGNVTISPNNDSNNLVYAYSSLTATYSGSEDVAYQWKKDGNAISGETSATYTPEEGGSYTVTVSKSGYNSKTSSAVTVTAFTPSAGLYAKAPPILPNDTAVSTVAANNVASAITYVNSNPKEFTLIIDQDVSAAPQSLSQTNAKLTIIGTGEERKITLSSNGALFTVGASSKTGIGLTIGKNITLVGRENNNNSVVSIGENSTFTMLDGSKVTGNTTDYNLGGAIYLGGANSSFIMNGGIITGNEGKDVSTVLRAGGLTINIATATVYLNGGSITGNSGPTADISCNNGTITLSGNAAIGELCRALDGNPVKIAEGWTGSVSKLNLRGTNNVLADIPEQYTGKQILEGANGYALKASDVAKFSNAYFNIQQTPFASQPVSDTHKIENSGENIGKLIRTVYSSFTTAPVLSLATGNAELTYTWTASNPTADSYDVYWKVGNNLSAADVKTGTKITGATSGSKITGLTNGTAYSVVVTANKAGYTSKDSAVQTATLPLLNFTTAPTLTLSSGNTELTYTWTASSPAADSYDIYYKAGSGLSAADVKTGTKITGATSGGKITSLANGTAYSVLVMANKTGYTSINSAVQTATPAAASTYGVTLSTTGTHTFTAATYSYASAPAALSVTITNTGNASTGSLTAALSGTNASDFTLSGTPISSITVGGTGSFTVVPKTGLSAGTHTATVTVTGSNSISASFNVSFTVNSKTIDIKAISGVTAPVTGATPVTSIAATDQYTGTVSWNGNPSTFAAATAYTATITLSAKTNYTLSGVTANYFTVSGATTVSNSANSGVVTAVFPATSAPYNYVITGSGTSFTATRSGTTVGTANQPIQTVIDAIRTNSNNNPVTIQFGDGTNVLDIGTATAKFSDFWGAITLTGKITGSVSSTTTGTIHFYIATNEHSVTSTADIANTASSSGRAIYYDLMAGQTPGTLTISGGTVSGGAGRAISNEKENTVNITGGTVSSSTGVAIRNVSTGTVNITGGTVTTTSTSSSGSAINNSSTGTVNISGGTVSATAIGGSGDAINNSSSGTVNISGGTVSAKYGRAVYNATGKISVSQPAGTTTTITSANLTSTSGTIHSSDSGTGQTTRLEITGGTIENTSTDTTARAVFVQRYSAIISGGTISTVSGYAIYFSSVATSDTPDGPPTSYLNITGGTIQTTASGTAVYIDNTAPVNISGGTLSATGEKGVVVYNHNSGKITVSGSAILTSAGNYTTSNSTIYLDYYVNNTLERLLITGGTIQNTAANGVAIYNASQAAINMGGGTVTATGTGGRAIHNASSGKLTITAGTVNGAGYSIYNYSSGVVSISSPPAVITGTRYP